MLRPVGSQPSSVYWRRRFVLLAAVVTLLVLIGLTARVLLSGSGAGAAAAGGTGPAGPSSGAPLTAASTSPAASSAGTSAVTTTPVSAPATSSPNSTGSSSPNSTASSGAGSSGAAAGSASGSGAVQAAACTPAQLARAAASGQTHYTTSDQPVLSLLVTNKGSAPCVQDLADKQVVLRVYNGESRVWGSHDCKVEPGVDDRTIMPGQTVRVSIVWSELSSQVGCVGTRQRVGAGTYTVYASLAGNEGTAAQFTIS